MDKISYLGICAKYCDNGTIYDITSQMYFRYILSVATALFKKLKNKSISLFIISAIGFLLHLLFKAMGNDMGDIGNDIVDMGNDICDIGDMGNDMDGILLMAIYRDIIEICDIDIVHGDTSITIQ